MERSLLYISVDSHIFCSFPIPGEPRRESPDPGGMRARKWGRHLTDRYSPYGYMGNSCRRDPQVSTWGKPARQVFPWEIHRGQIHPKTRFCPGEMLGGLLTGRARARPGTWGNARYSPGEKLSVTVASGPPSISPCIPLGKA